MSRLLQNGVNHKGLLQVDINILSLLYVFLVHMLASMLRKMLIIGISYSTERIQFQLKDVIAI